MHHVEKVEQCAVFECPHVHKSIALELVDFAIPRYLILIVKNEFSHL